MSVNFTIRALGGPGVGSVVSLGVFNKVKQANGNSTAFAFNTVNNTTFDTTIINTFNVTAQFNSTSVQNSIFSDICIVNKVY
jgi:hypothetical protein